VGWRDVFCGQMSGEENVGPGGKLGQRFLICELHKLQNLKSNYLQATDLIFENFNTHSTLLEIYFWTSRPDLSKPLSLVRPTERENA
jgi:hypothetical protein